MPSLALNRLRDAAKEQQQIYSKAKKKLTEIARDRFLDEEVRKQMIMQTQEQARENLAELKARMAQSKGAIEKAASARRVEATPEARAKVEKAMASGWDIASLMQQLVSEGDRAAVSALKDALPYMARASQLPGPNYHKQVAHAQEIIGQFEPALWDEAEQALHAEARELAVNFGLIESNSKQIDAWIGRQLLGAGSRETVSQMYRWCGTPEDTSIQKGIFDPNLDEVTA